MTSFKVKNPMEISYKDAKIGYKGPFEFDFKISRTPTQAANYV